MPRSPSVCWLTIAVLGAACAAGSDGDEATTTTGGGVPWTTSTGGASSGGHSEGGSPTTGGSSSDGGGGTSPDGGGGAGTGATGGGGQSGDGGFGGDGGSGGGPPQTGQIVLVAASASSLFAAHFEPTNGWSTDTISASPTDRPAIGMRAQDDAVVVFRNLGPLSFTKFNGLGWTAASNVAAGVTTRAAPSATANGTTAFAVYQGDNFMHYFAAYTAGFSPTAEVVGSPQSFGPAPAAIAMAGVDPIIVFTGNDGDLYDQTRASGSWQAANPHSTATPAVIGTPAITAMGGSGDLLVLFNRTNTAVSYVTRSSGSWSSPADVPDVLTNDPVSIAATSGGKAVAAFRGTNGKLYTTLYDPLAAPVWSTPVALSGGTVSTNGPPAVAPGVGSLDAELAYVDAGTGTSMHARLTGATWSAPASVGGTNLVSIALASKP